MSRNRASNACFFLFFLLVSVLVIVTSDSVAAGNEDRPESSITEDLPDWFNNDDDDVEIKWEASDPDSKKIDRIYFWACYYEDEEDCKGTETDVDDWERIKNHNIIPDEAEPQGVTDIPIDDFLSKFEDKEGRYKVITCAVNEDGFAEYGKENSAGSGGNANGCYRYKTESHSTFLYFNSSKMKEFGFDESAPEILIEIERYNKKEGSTKILSYEMGDEVSKLSVFSLEYQFNSLQWIPLDDNIVSEETTYINSTDFEYDQDDNCGGCGQGDYKFRLEVTDIAGNEQIKIVTSTLDFSEPELKNHEAVGPHVNDWLNVDDEITLEWEGEDDISGIESVKIRYCLWENIESVDPTKSLWPEDFENENILILTVPNSVTEGLYYFFPVLTDYAGNPSESILCQGHEDERFMLDKTPPTASLGPGESIHNEATTISILSVSDNIELNRTVLWYAYSEEFDYDAPTPSFSGHYEIYSSGSLSGKITTDDTNVSFNFPDGPGTYRFFLETDDNHTFTSEIEMTLIYDTEAPESQIVSGGEETSFTNLEKYSVNCRATDPNYEVDEVSLYFRYKERESHTFGNWSYGHATTYSIDSTTGDCKIDFDFEAFEGDGYYQFYTVAVDKAGNEEEEKEDPELTIIRDKTSPEFELLYLESDAEEFLSLNANTIYYNSAGMTEGRYQINFTASLRDYLSGVNETSGSSDHNWSWNEGFLSIDYDFNTSETDENKTITLTISDLAGNPSEIVINFEEDSSAPIFLLYNSVLKHPIDEGGVLQVRSNETNIWITVFNSGSPVSSYELSLDDSEWSVLNPTNPSFLIPSNKSKASIRVIDSLGNSISKNFVVEYDDQGPEFESLDPSNSWYDYANNIYYVRGPVTIELRASDSPSGLDRIEFRYEEEEWKEYNNSLNLFEEAGVWQLNFSYRGIDKLGNVEEHETTFIIDDTTALIDSSLITFTLSNSGDDSDNKLWNGSEVVDYDLFNTLWIELADISDEGGAGISATGIEIEYSRDNQIWTKYDNTTGIELSSSSMYIRVTVTDKVGNTEKYVIGKPIEVTNVPIAETTESESNFPILALLVVVAIAGSVVAYGYRQTQLSDSEDDTETIPKKTEAPAIKCPKCNVLIPAESVSCAFCGARWDGAGNIILGGPFASAEEKIIKEVVPRTGEILIGPDLERWKIETGARSSIGGRGNNEDSISWNSFLRATNDTPHSIRLGIVADGVGGHNKGEIASSLVISAINESVSKAVNDPFHTEIFTPREHLDILEKAYHYANDAVCGRARENEYVGMATTAVTIYLWEDKDGDNGFLIGNVGDSRGYLINSERIEQVTKDDSEVQKLIDAGEITESEAKNHPRKNVITQAIGNKKVIRPRIETYSLKDCEFDSILLCSDGVSDKMSDREIHKIVNQFDNPQDVCNRIIKIINRTNTNHDNISLILMKFPNLFMEG